MAGDEVLIQLDMLLGGRAVRYEAPQLATEAQAFPRNVEAPLLGVLVDHGHPGDAGTERHICRHIPAKSSSAWVRNDVTMKQLHYECA